MTGDESGTEDPELKFWTMLRDTNTRLVREDGFVWRPLASSSRSDLDLPPVVRGWTCRSCWSGPESRA
ncbi:hypothetical protein [Streptomyces sp. NPDC092903]|uniref:hypothetical protein n=1 Tax=Streptomyces sp. NPDC092903 TaxID=3366017 RepID=UPI003822E386